MRWFKHMTCAYDDTKLSAMMDELGMEGYGFWWRILEVIAEQMDETGNCFCTFSAKKWGTFFGFSARKFQNFVGIFQNLKIFEVKLSGNSITIIIPNLLKYKDEWSRKKARNSGAAPEKLRSKETEIEREREENINNHPLPSCEEGRCAGEGVLTPRRKSANPRALGTNPCAIGTNLRSPGTNPRAAPAAPEQPGIGGTEADPPPADPAAMDLGFHEFLNAYPAAHREPVGEAAQVWKKLAREKSLPGLPRLLQGLDAWEDSDQWRKDDGAYIPKAANFLRRSMWLSAPAPARASPGDDWEQARREGEARRARLRAAASGAVVPGAETGVAAQEATA